MFIETFISPKSELYQPIWAIHSDEQPAGWLGLTTLTVNAMPQRPTTLPSTTDAFLVAQVGAVVTITRDRALYATEYSKKVSLHVQFADYPDSHMIPWCLLDCPAAHTIFWHMYHEQIGSCVEC
jgi:hypothetical protein